jgi:hypothetical protein
VSSAALEAIALTLTAVVHFVGAGVLIWSILDGDGIDWRKALKPGDGGVGPTPGPARTPDGGGDGAPLPAAEQSRHRLREAKRLADLKRAERERRPSEVPAPTPTPAEPARERELV